MLNLDHGAAYVKGDCPAAAHEGDDARVIAGIGAFETLVGQKGVNNLGPVVVKDLLGAIKEEHNFYKDGRFTGFFKSSRGTENLVHMSGLGELSELDRSLLDVFANNVGVAFENIELHQDIEETQREIVYMLGEAVEKSSKKTGHHVSGWGAFCKIQPVEVAFVADQPKNSSLAPPLPCGVNIGIRDPPLILHPPPSPQTR